ncbi:WS/DGAT domain-containing protein [Mycobacterium sp.]|uniref:WS/DGAT domain-containing protein n=1 Tax=Mycobacterium sp. TaxID=1785 RepID=UPI002C3D4337|nr:WS/DGAT domain-containing protein [Mycobacterium sp.]HTQ17369.1 WS/DGAT domain-containing protein [Mycobacterium sp.]
MQRLSSLTVVSYHRGLDIGIVGDAQTLPEAWDLMDDLRQELADLSALADTEKSSEA